MMPTETRDIAIRCNDCGHIESFASDTGCSVDYDWEQPCNKCGHNWHTIIGDENQ